MIEIKSPQINTEAIENKLIKEIEHLKTNKTNNNILEPIKFPLNIMESQIKYLQGFIDTAKSRSGVRDKLPDSFNKFPLIIFKPLGKFLLKILNFLFKDQREVNNNIIGALEESVKLNQMLLEEIKNNNLHSQNELSKMALNFDLLNCNLDEKNNQINDKFTHLEKKQEDLFYKTVYFQSDLTQQKTLLNWFVNQQSNHNIETENDNPHLLQNPEYKYLDSFYLALENKFRGLRKDIKNQQKQDYFALLKDLNIDVSNGEILDIGCGRGEWLELLQESGYKAQGIDLNDIMVQECQARGLDVVSQDGINYLQSRSNQSIKLITGFHLIEHLPFPILWQLLSESLRVLKSGGLVIFETPNPDNILVASRNFYIDPTHRNPLPSAMVKFLLESIGFVNVEIVNLHPISHQNIEGGELANRFNEYFYCSQDYAVIGYKP